MQTTIPKPSEPVFDPETGDMTVAWWRFLHDPVFNSIQTVTPIPSIGTWQKVGDAISYTSFSTAGTTISISLFNLVANGVVDGIKIKHSTAFAGAGITAVTLSVGIAGVLDKYASPFDVFQAVGPRQISGGNWCESDSVVTSVLLTATSTGANLNALTAGVVDIWAMVSTAG